MPGRLPHGQKFVCFKQGLRTRWVRCPLSPGPALPAHGAGEKPAGHSRLSHCLGTEGESLSRSDFPALDPRVVPLQHPAGLLTALGVPPILSSKLKLLLALTLSREENPIWGALKTFSF